MNRIQKYRNFFEKEVAIVIEPIIKEWLNETNPTTADEDFYDVYKYAKLSQGENSSDTFLEYYFMSEPYTHIEMDFKNSIFKATIADQMQIHNRFETSNIYEFITYWNNFIVEYYRFNTTLPILHQVDE